MDNRPGDLDCLDCVGVDMNDKEQWLALQALAKERARKDLLEEILSITGLDNYIKELIANHEQNYHGDDSYRK